MTSNLGANKTGSSNSLGFFTSDSAKSDAREREKSIKSALERTFKPELLNRVDEIVIFNSLTKENIEEICLLLLSSLSERLKGLGIDIAFTHDVCQLIVAGASDAREGARGLRREIRRLIENPLSSKMISGEISVGDALLASVEGGVIVFEK